jgi:hypothetical protein
MGKRLHVHQNIAAAAWLPSSHDRLSHAFDIAWQDCCPVSPIAGWPMTPHADGLPTWWWCLMGIVAAPQRLPGQR